MGEVPGGEEYGGNVPWLNGPKCASDGTLGHWIFHNKGRSRLQRRVALRMSRAQMAPN